MTRIYTFANQKGGVGKTTTAINVAAYIAARGKQVLLVDMDPQSNASSSLGAAKDSATYSIYNSLVDEVPVEQFLMPTKRLNLDLVPASSALAGAEVELVAMENRERLLAHALSPITIRYDYIIIDSPPSLGLLTLNALVAADAVIVPIQCEYLALEGLSQLMNTIQLVQASLNPRLQIGGMLMTMFDSRTHLALQVVEEVAKHFPQHIFRTVVPRSVRIAEAPSFGEPLISFDPKSRGAQAYEALTAELLEREKKMEDGELRMETQSPSSVIGRPSGV